MTRVLFFHAFFLFVVGTGLAQKNFFSGYYLNQNGDTVNCMVNNDLFFNNKNKRVICKDENGKRHKFKPSHILGYGMEKGPNYNTLSSSTGKKYFAKVEQKGKLILYDYTKIVTVTQHTLQGDFSHNVNRHKFFIQRSGEKEIKEIPQKNFKEVLLEYIKDNKQVKELLEDKTLKYADIGIVIYKYNKSN